LLIFKNQNVIILSLLIFVIHTLLGCAKVKTTFFAQEQAVEFSLSPKFGTTYLNQELSFDILGGVGPFTIEKMTGSGTATITGSKIIFSASSSAEIAQFKIVDSTMEEVYLTVQVVDASTNEFQAVLLGAPSRYSNISTTDITVAGADIVSYRYALIRQDESCALAIYSDARPITEKIIEPLSAEIFYKICTVGINSIGSEQLKTSATIATWERDVTPPTAPSSVLDGTSSTITTSSPVISFVSGTDAKSGIYSAEARIVRPSDNTVFKGWSPIANNTTVTGLALEAGYTYRAEIRMKDFAGNVSSSANGDGWSQVFPVPVLTVTNVTGTFYLDQTNIASFLVAGNCSEIGENVSFTGTGLGLVVSTPCLAGGTFSVSLNFTAAADGAISIDGIIYNSAGTLSASVALNGTKDSSDPGTTHIFAKIGGNANADVFNLTRDSQGNIYAVGRFGNDSSNSANTKDFAGNRLDGRGTALANNCYVAKFRSDGSQHWIRVFGGNVDAVCTNVEMASDGSVLVFGYSTENNVRAGLTRDFAGANFFGLLPGSQGTLFLAKLDSSGTQLWLKKAAATGPLGVIASDMVVDAAGNIIVAAGCDLGATGNIDFNGNSFIPNFGGGGNGWDSAIFKLDSSGNQLWFKHAGGNFFDGLYDKLATDSTGAIYIATSIAGNSANDGGTRGYDGNLMPGLVTSGVTSRSDLHIIKLDADGTQTYHKLLGSFDDDIPLGLAVSASNDVYLGIQTDVNSSPVATFIDFDGNPHFARPGNSGVEYFVIKLNSSFQQQWIKQLGSNSALIDYNDNYWSPSGFAIDGLGNAYLAFDEANDYLNTFLFSDTLLKPVFGRGETENYDAFVVKLASSDGNQEWIRTMGGTSDDAGYAVYADAIGRVYFGGSFINDSSDSLAATTFRGEPLTGLGSTAVRNGVIYYLDPTDPCDGTPRIGSACQNGTVYAGVYAGRKYMITPSGCTDSSTPECNGGIDTLRKTYNDGTTNWFEVPGIELINDLEIATTQRGNIGTNILVGITAPEQGGVHQAAKYCQDLNFGGYTDWYLPAMAEISYIYCKSAGMSTHNPLYPNEFPNCTSVGGRQSLLPGFTTGFYSAVNQPGAGAGNLTNAAAQFSDGNMVFHLKNALNYLRCVRSY
jgi:hypothetical protein